MVAVAAGAWLYVVAAIDDVTSWPSNRVLISDPELSHLAGALLLPGWPWLMASYWMVFGVPRRARPGPRPQWPVRWPWAARVFLAAAAVLCVAVAVGGFANGAAKGSARVLPGPRYEVMTPDLHQASWTAVSAAEYHVWQARFVREDGSFMFFGLVLSAGCLGFLQLHRNNVRGG